VKSLSVFESEESIMSIKFKKLKKPQIFGITAVFCFIITTISFQVGTQQYAKSQNYHPLLDKQKVTGHIYTPFAIMQWRKQFNKLTPKEFKQSLYAPMTGGSLALFIFFIAAMILKTKKLPESHGTARWATDDEFEAKDMTKPEGVMLGVMKNGKYIRHNGPEHIICYAPTRSGKGVGIIIPSLLSWRHSVLVTDIKGENWAITAGFRQKIFKNKVIKFDPTCTDGTGARFNPLEEIRIRTNHEVKDTQRIVNMIVDPQGKGELDHWGKTAGALLTGLILYVLYTRPNKSLSEVASIINDPNEADIGATLLRMANEEHSDEATLSSIYEGTTDCKHPIIWNSLVECANKPADERGSVISTAVSNLALYRDPIIAANISKSDFKIADLMNYDVPVSLYIVIPPSDLDRVVPLTRIIINQIFTTLTEKMKFVDAKPVADYKHRLLLLIDEFPAFGSLQNLEKALAFIAGYGLKALLIVQSLNQLNKIYSKENSILDNMHVQIAYTPNDNTTAREISDALDTSTIMVTSQSYEKGAFMGARKSGLSESGRKLMTPGELRVMPYADELVFVAGINPYKAKKIIYYTDENFKKRLLPPPEKSDRLYNLVEPESKRGKSKTLESPTFTTPSAVPPDLPPKSIEPPVLPQETLSEALQPPIDQSELFEVQDEYEKMAVNMPVTDFDEDFDILSEHELAAVNQEKQDLLTSVNNETISSVLDII
jgi:type IV secretion system protein VirD4